MTTCLGTHPLPTSRLVPQPRSPALRLFVGLTLALEPTTKAEVEVGVAVSWWVEVPRVDAGRRSGRPWPIGELVEVSLLGLPVDGDDHRAIGFSLRSSTRGHLRSIRSRRAPRRASGLVPPDTFSLWVWPPGAAAAGSMVGHRRVVGHHHPAAEDRRSSGIVGRPPLRARSDPPDHRFVQRVNVGSPTSTRSSTVVRRRAHHGALIGVGGLGDGRGVVAAHPQVRHVGADRRRGSDSTSLPSRRRRRCYDDVDVGSSPAGRRRPTAS